MINHLHNIDYASTLYNIGNVYLDKGELDLALEKCQQALDLEQKTGNLDSIASTLHCIGEVYMEQQKLKESLELLKKSLKLFQENNNQIYISEVRQRERS